MASEIIVEFPSPLTEKEKKMIYGYKGEVVRCKDCKYADEYARCGWVSWYNRKDDFCSRAERREDEID